MIAVCPILFILFGTKRFITTLKAREAAHSQAQHDLGVAAGTAQADAKWIAALEAKNTQLTHANQQLTALYQERDAMAQALAARNDRLGDATHDIKQPLMFVSYKANAILASATHPDTRADAQELIDELDHIGQMLVRITDEAQISTRLTPAPKLVLPVPALREYFLERFNSLALDYGVTLKCQQKNHPDFAIQSNEELFKRLIGNLLHNAITYAEPQDWVFLTFYYTPKACIVRVWDTGRGIAGVQGPDRYANFLTLLDKIEQQRTADGLESPASLAKNGIGLHSVHRLSQELGLRISVQSRPGKGTAFRCKVPLAAPPQ